MQMFIVLVLSVYLTVAHGGLDPSLRIVGGRETSISYYQSTAALFFSSDLTNFQLKCGCTILNTKNLLTTANCVYGYPANRYRVRVGSTYASQQGTVHEISSYVIHNNYVRTSYDYDIAVMRVATSITYVPGSVQPAHLATSLYDLPDNTTVWIAGWGKTAINEPVSDHLRHVMMWTVNQNICVQRFGNPITENMLCAGWLDEGGRDSCRGDGGSPLITNGVVVGISSWGRTTCGEAYYPGVYTRVSKFIPWIAANIA